VTGTIATFDDARRSVRDGHNPAEVARQLVATMSPAEKLWCLDGDMPVISGLAFYGSGGYHAAPAVAGAIDRIGFPGIAFSDGPRGCVIGNATCFPVPMARGATWDPDLEERVGRAMGAEMRASGANFTGAVCVNILRHPAWGRAQETYGEDPHHVGELGAAFTRGLQRHVMACVKHFACNSMENARFTVDVQVDDVALHEVYLPHFRRIVDEGVAAVMSAYNSVNGDWCGQNRQLLTDILREEWGFTGVTISDFVFGVRDARASLRAGLDVEMPARMIRCQYLPAALEDGSVSWPDVEAAAERLVATLLRFDDVLGAEGPGPEIIGSEEHRALAQEVATRSIVLLKNDPVRGAPLLPMPTHARLAVFGRLADTVNLGDMGSSDVWDLEAKPVLHGLRSVFDEVVYEDGSDPIRVQSAAGAADTCIVVVGFTHEDEGEYLGTGTPDMTGLFPAEDEPEVAARFAAGIAHLAPAQAPARAAANAGGFAGGGDRQSLRLSDDQVDLIRTVATANPRTVVVIQGGSATICSEWGQTVPAVMVSWYGGCEAGPALADVLTGQEDATGRLPFSVPVRETDLPPFDAAATSFVYDQWHGWWHLARSGTTAEYPFGFGLSYTEFRLHDVSAVVTSSGSIMARGTIRNTGGRPSSDVVQVYAQLPDPQRPARLVGFRRIRVDAGSEGRLEIEVSQQSLATWDPVEHAWRSPRGVHHLSVGRYAGDPDAATIPVELEAR
jgi:beta-glucosidase